MHFLLLSNNNQRIEGAHSPTHCENALSPFEQQESTVMVSNSQQSTLIIPVSF
jgi:hypothetical protein